MIDWLSDLEWSTEGDIAVVEAAIDLELFSGLNVKAPSKTAKTHREKANIIRCMLNAISKLAVRQQLGNLAGSSRRRHPCRSSASAAYPASSPDPATACLKPG
ncbi:hypothetical protein DIPPA_28759 [Diplonema papillatum]|nr:hypothetical protein DIPPA_28759 [Diplonema papillatum]